MPEVDTSVIIHTQISVTQCCSMFDMQPERKPCYGSQSPKNITFSMTQIPKNLAPSRFILWLAHLPIVDPVSL
jgi:hypothetical protein